MSDCMDFGSCGPSISCSEGACFSECWGPSCGDSYVSYVSSSSDYSSFSSSSSSSLDMNTSNLYSSSQVAEPIARGAIDSSKSVSALVQDGTFIQSNKAPRLDQSERSAGESPKVIVTNDASVTPDYIVRQDGKVEVVGNPESGDKAHGVYRVQVEPGADQKTTDDLVKYINDRIQTKEPSSQVTLDAAPGLVSESVASLFNRPAPENNDETNPDDENPPPEDDYSPSDPGGGDCPNSPSDDPPYDPQDTPDEQPDNQPLPDSEPFAPKGPIDDILDASRLNSWENNTLGSLGAYEVNMVNWFSSWLDAEMLAELGDPPDYRKLGKVLAKHKAKFQQGMNSRLDNMKEQGDTAGAEKLENLFNRIENDPTFAENFGIFMNSQRGGEGSRNATGEEMNNYFDKDLQKAIASSRMSDIAHEAGVKIKDLPPDQAAKMALAGALGHVPSEKEMADYNRYLQVVQDRYKQPLRQIAQN